MKKLMTGVATAALLLTASSAARAQDGSGVYNLGQINVEAGADDDQTINAFGGSVLTSKQIRKLGKLTLDKAVNLVPGVVSTNTGGTRNEQNIFVRGFDRWQVPLSLDGVRLYLPADNRIDFGRFLTDDIAEIQIAKSYVSVLDGPGGMGGAINLVSRKPEKEYEGELRSIVEMGRNGRYEGITNYGRVGMRKEAGYLQASGTWRDFDGWDMSHDFKPTPNEDGGRRDNSDTKDWNLNLKAGYTPNATDEYSVNFLRQEGAKGAPYHVDDPIISQRYWDWPEWNVQNLAFLSKTQLGDQSHLKTKFYWNKFDNLLSSFDDAAQTTQSLPKAFDSYYDDYGLGADLEAGHDFGDLDTLKAAFHYRRDSHTEWNENYRNATGGTTGCTVNVVCFVEPKQTSVEDTYSFALENTWHVRSDFDLVQGVSYDLRNLIEAEDYASGAFVFYPKKDANAWNAQAAAIWRYAEDAKLFANVSDRTRFPTLFERFSSRFGGATSNPGLKPERAINYQVGWSKAFGAGRQVSADVFYADVKDMIQSVPIVYNGQNLTQNQNVGDGYFYGAEGSVDFAVNDTLALGGNLSVIERHVNAPYIAGFKPTGVPEVKGFVYATLTPIDGLTITPTLEFAGKRWTVTSNGATYYKTGDYALLNVYVDYDFGNGFSVNAGARNILDQNYVLTDGYPEAGRSFFLSARKTF